MIPCCYVFRYDDPEKREKALKRLYCSIESIKNQTDEIYVIDASENPIEVPICVNIINHPQTGTFNKSQILNYGVKHYLSDYIWCILADADIIFEPDYVKKMEAYTHGEPVRVTGYSQSAYHEFYTSDYNEAMRLINDRGVTAWRSGEAPGIGLLHIPSFLKIRGFNEKFREYSCEDTELNRRLAYINKYIYDPTIKNVHLFHEPNAANFTNENNEIYYESERLFQSGNLARNDPDTWDSYE